MTQERYKISSFLSVKNTLRNDYYTQCWFYFILQQKNVQQTCFQNTQESKALYQLTLFYWMGSITKLSIFGLLALLVPGFIPLEASLCLMPLIAFYIYVRKSYKPRLVDLSLHLLQSEFTEEDFKYRTMFEISEILSEKYQTISLIDAIAFSSDVMRHFFLIGIIMPWPSFIQSLAIFVFLYQCCNQWINSSIFYSHLSSASLYTNRTSLFKKSVVDSFDVVGSFLMSVLIFYFLDIGVWSYYFSDAVILTHGTFIYLFRSLLSVVFMSGVYGSLIELTTQQRYVISYQSFFANIKRCSPVFLGLFVIFYFIKELFSPFIPNHILLMLYGLIDVSFTVALAYGLFLRKYKKCYALDYLPIKLHKRDVFYLVLWAVCLLMSYGILSFVRGSSYYSSLIFLLLIKFSYLALFVFTVQLILKAYPEVDREFSTGKELFIVNPLLGENIIDLVLNFRRGCLPLYTVLRTFTPEHYRVIPFNTKKWHRRYNKKGILVAITSTTLGSASAYAIAKGLRYGGAKVIMGGAHVSLLPQEALKYCDSVVIGEAEGLWTDIVSDFEQDDLKEIYRRRPTPEDYARVHQTLLASSPLEVSDYMEPTSGCKFRCEFCAVHVLSKTVRNKQITEMVELLKIVKQQYKSVLFFGDNFYLNPDYAKELARELVQLDLVWRANCSIDVAADEEMLDLLEKSHCAMLGVGYEIIDSEQVELESRKLNYAHNHIEYTQRLKQHKVKVLANFIIGFRWQTYQSFVDYWLFCLRMFPFFTSCSYLVPLPGTPIYEDVLAEDRLATLNWSDYYPFHVVFYHPHMNYHVLKILVPFYAAFIAVTTSRFGLILFVTLVFVAGGLVFLFM